VLGPAFSGDVNYAPADREVASGVIRVGDGDGDARSTLRTFWNPLTVLIRMCSPSVSTQVWVSCGEPSGMVVAM
jgi:hypothetical protein